MGATSSGSGGGGSPAGGSGGKATGGSGGKASGGTSSGGNAGTGGKGTAGSAGSGGGSAGSGEIGTGSCADTPAFKVGTYALNAKVFATCNGGTPCTLPKPPLTNGKSYEFKCTDQYNCGGQDPGTTNWGQPPWAVTQACE